MTFDPSRPTTPEAFDPLEPASFAPQPVAATGPRAPLVKPKSSSRAVNAVLALAVLVAVGGIAFAIGRTTAPAAAANPRGALAGGFPGGSFAPNGSFTPDASGFPGGFPGGGLGRAAALTGTVESLTPDLLTITTDTGQTIQIGLDTDTDYHAESDATSADVVVGSTVQVAVDFAAGLGQPNASPDPSVALGPATDVTVVK
jgi:hypothetical protein